MQLKNILTCAACAAVTIATASSAFAHDVVGGSEHQQKRTLDHIQKVENYMAKNYNLSLGENVTVILAKNTKEFRQYKEKLDSDKHELKFEYDKDRAFAVQDSPTILLNYGAMNVTDFKFYLTHELVHRYQVQEAAKKGLSVDDNAVYSEGIADLIAARMTNKYIRNAADFGEDPSYELLKPAKNFNLALEEWTPHARKNELTGSKQGFLYRGPGIFSFDGIPALSRYYAAKIESERQKQGLPPAVFVE